MRKPILIGNSCGGDIVHTLGAQHPVPWAASFTLTPPKTRRSRWTY